MWEIVIQMPGDAPSETEVEQLEEAIVDALDEASISYADVHAK